MHQKKSVQFLGAVSKFLYRYGIFLAAIILFFVAITIAPLVKEYKTSLKLLPWFIPGIWAYWIQSFIVNALSGLRRYKDVVLAHIYALIAYVIVLPISTKYLGLAGAAWGYNTFCLVLLGVCLSKLRDTQLVGKRFSLFSPFTESEKTVLKQLGDKIMNLPFRGRE